MGPVGQSVDEIKKLSDKLEEEGTLRLPSRSLGKKLKM